jgi:hypothetical protein
MKKIGCEASKVGRLLLENQLALSNPPKKKHTYAHCLKTKGTTTSSMTIKNATVSITGIRHNDTFYQNNTQYGVLVMLSVTILNAIRLNATVQNAVMLNISKTNAILLNATVLNAIILNAIMLNVIMLNVNMLNAIM